MGVTVMAGLNGNSEATSRRQPRAPRSVLRQPCPKVRVCVRGVVG